MDDYYDPLLDQAIYFIVEKRRASISGVQRQFRIGYNRAARIIELLESIGVVSSPSLNGNREVLADIDFEYDTSKLKELYDKRVRGYQEDAEKQHRIANSPENIVRLSAITNKKITIWLTETGKLSPSGGKVLILNSSSPFEYLVSNQKSKIKPGDVEYSDILDGYRFSATISMNTPTSVLCQHGREEKLPAHRLPKVVKNDLHGFWIPRIRPASEIGNFARDVKGGMASELGTIPSDGGDYLRFLIFMHQIIKDDIDDEEREMWLNLCYHMVGSDGELISQYIKKFGSNAKAALQNIKMVMGLIK